MRSKSYNQKLLNQKKMEQKSRKTNMSVYRKKKKKVGEIEEDIKLEKREKL